MSPSKNRRASCWAYAGPAKHSSDDTIADNATIRMVPPWLSKRGREQSIPSPQAGQEFSLRPPSDTRASHRIICHAGELKKKGDLLAPRDRNPVFRRIVCPCSDCNERPRPDEK